MKQWIKKIWHDPVMSVLIAAAIGSILKFIYDNLKSIDWNNIFISIKEIILGKREISNITYYVLVFLSLFCVFDLFQFIRQRMLSKKINAEFKEFEEKNIPIPMVKENTDSQGQYWKKVANENPTSLYWEKGYAIKNIKYIVSTFKYNWENDNFISTGNISYAKKLLDELEMELREARNKLDPELNNNSKNYLTEILNDIKSLKSVSSLPPPISLIQSSQSGSELINKLDKIETLLK